MLPVSRSARTRIVRPLYVTVRGTFSCPRPRRILQRCRRDPQQPPHLRAEHRHRLPGDGVAERVARIAQRPHHRLPSFVCNCQGSKLPSPATQPHPAQQRQSPRADHHSPAPGLHAHRQAAQGHAQKHKEHRPLPAGPVRAEGRPAHEPQAHRPPQPICQKREPRHQAHPRIAAPQRRRSRRPGKPRRMPRQPVDTQEQTQIHQKIQPHKGIEINDHLTPPSVGQSIPPGQRKMQSYCPRKTDANSPLIHLFLRLKA